MLGEGRLNSLLALTLLGFCDLSLPLFFSLSLIHTHTHTQMAQLSMMFGSQCDICEHPTPPYPTPPFGFFPIFQQFLHNPAHPSVAISHAGREKTTQANLCLFKTQMKSNKSWFLNTLWIFHMQAESPKFSLWTASLTSSPIHFCHPKNTLAGLHSTLKFLPPTTERASHCPPGGISH